MFTERACVGVLCALLSQSFACALECGVDRLDRLDRGHWPDNDIIVFFVFLSV